jgi:hypothetical protein
MNYFNYKIDGGKNAYCCTATGRKLLTSSGISDMYTFLKNTWNTLPESYQQRAYKNTIATVKHQTQQTENQTPTVVISVDAARVDNVILPDNVTCDVVLEETEIGCTYGNIQRDHNCTNDNQDCEIPEGSGD